MVQGQGGATVQPAGILEYVEDLERGTNAEIGPDNIFEMASIQTSKLAPRVFGFFLLALIAILAFTTTASGQQPYGGTPWPVPGTIEAEDYDTGGEAVAYHDRTAGNNGLQYRTDDVDIWYSGDLPEGYYTGANATGEWLAYTVNVAHAGSYMLDLRVATPNSGRQMRVELDGVDVTGIISVPNTGDWQAWQTVSTTADLTAGQHVLRIVFVVGGLNLNWIDIYDPL